MEELLREGLAQLGIAAVPEGALTRLRRYYTLLEERGRVMNLTAITGERDVAQLHFLDSAALLCGEGAAFFTPGARVVDVGTGAGFPGLVLKLLCPELCLTLLDSQRKRVDFLGELCGELGLSDVECLHARAEELGQDPVFREVYDLAVSRAVAQLGLLSELCLPLVKPGGVFLAMKGPEHTEELASAYGAMELLGGGDVRTWDYTIPGTEVRHSVVCVPKLRATPAAYPRRWAKIQKKPLHSAAR